ncbi:MAG: sodium:solute symporter [Chloroflexi bacterium]|nr:sodium:solute symporter [Chloroflexota bacterium]
MDWVATIVFLALFVVVTYVGFAAARWRRGDLSHITEWGLANRQFGTIVSWFLVGGDLFTAYTFVAVPGTLYGAGAVGFFAVPYTVVVWPLVFFIMPRLWVIAKKHGYITAADWIHHRTDSGLLALAIAVTGIVATMPYIALQLVGMQVVIASLGFTGLGLAGDLPLIVAFLVLALYTYSSGLRAPALTAIVKDCLIYITCIVAAIYIPIKLGGYGHIFQAADLALKAHKPPSPLILPPGAFSAYGTLALGSALALYMYPHAITAVFSSKSGGVIRRNSAMLGLYSLLLAFMALLGYFALAAHVTPKTPNFAVPALFVAMFPSWFVGVTFAAIVIGALVPSAVMSIAAANLFTRNIYKTYFRPNCSTGEEARAAKITSFVVKFGALIFVIFLPQQYAINFQLLGGILISQTFPAVVFSLYTRWFHRWALLLGWAAGIVAGIAMAVANKFAGSVYALHLGGFTYSAYAAVLALALNIVVAVVFTIIFDALGVARGRGVEIEFEAAASAA